MKTQPLIDAKLYSVHGLNGYRKPSLTQAEALRHARMLLDQMQEAGWRGKVDVVYRDGTTVWTGRVG